MEGEGFFLGLLIRQINDVIFISQSKFAKYLVSKFGLNDSKPFDTPMSISKKIIKDASGVSVDTKLYKGMIGSLLYLIATRLGNSFSVGSCARHQVDSKESHLKALK